MIVGCIQIQWLKYIMRVNFFFFRFTIVCVLSLYQGCTSVDIICFCPITLLLYIQMPMLDYCLYSCFLKSISSCSGISQGCPQRLFVLLQEILLKCPFLISPIINSITRRVLAFSMFILSKRPNPSASSYKENANSSPHHESHGLNKRSVNM